MVWLTRVHQQSKPRFIDCSMPNSLDDDYAATLAQAKWEAFEGRSQWLSKVQFNRCATDCVQLIFSGDEVESLVQVLNDMRMFCWEKLGCPDPVPHCGVSEINLSGFPRERKALEGALEIASALQNAVCQQMFDVGDVSEHQDS